jgi:hypothetical protein
VPETVSGFHAQQAVEKLIKALLLELKVPFDLTHDLTRLQKLLEAAGEKLPSTPLSLGDLNDFAVFYRYELSDEYELPVRGDLLDTVRIIREHVIARIAVLTRTSSE